MKVKELILQLKDLDSNLDIYCTSDYEIPHVKNGGVIAFAVDDPSEISASLYRDASGILCVQAEVPGDGRKIAVLNIVLDQR